MHIARMSPLEVERGILEVLRGANGLSLRSIATEFMRRRCPTDSIAEVQRVVSYHLADLEHAGRVEARTSHVGSVSVFAARYATDDIERRILHQRLRFGGRDIIVHDNTDDPIITVTAPLSTFEGEDA